jgi:hypothetical protein
LQSYFVWPTAASCFWRRQFWGKLRRIILKIQFEYMKTWDPPMRYAHEDVENKGINVCTRINILVCMQAHVQLSSAAWWVTLETSVGRTRISF